MLEANDTNTETATFINSGDKGAGVSRLTRMEKARRSLREIASAIDGIGVKLNNTILQDLAIRLDRVEGTLYNRTPVRSGKRTVSAPMTHDMRESIKLYAERNPEITFAEIGKLFNVNGARVSEVVAGLRR
jgi:hypothetical protein